jgi:hypothetical protein
MMETVERKRVSATTPMPVSLQQLTVYDVIRQSNTSSVRAHRHALLRRHEQNTEDLVDARETARVDLANVDRFRSEELLEDHAVVRVLASCCAGERESGMRSFADKVDRSGRTDANLVRLELLADLRVPEDVIL